MERSTVVPKAVLLIKITSRLHIQVMAHVVAKILTANAIVVVVVVFLAQKQEGVVKLLVKK